MANRRLVRDDSNLGAGGQPESHRQTGRLPRQLVFRLVRLGPSGLKLWTDNWARLSMALQLLALASAAHITAPTSTTRIHLISIMFSETFFPMAAANSVPRTVHKYHYEHSPPPSSSVELTAELHRNLRAVPHGGFWGKVKSVGWRLLRESIIYLIYTRPTALTTFLESNSRAASSSPSGARTSRSHPRRVPSPALVNSPLTFTSTQRDVRTFCLVRPGPRRTGSFTFLLAHLACQDVA